MNDIFLMLLFFTVFAVTWIEWIPERYGIFAKLFLSLVIVFNGILWLPAWYGWIVVSLGIAQLAWIYFSPKRRSAKTNCLTAARMRNTAGAVLAVIFSPIAALPLALVLSALLFVWDAVYGNAPQVDSGMQEAARKIAGVAVVIVFATVDLLSRYFLISGPLLLAGGYAIAARAIGSGAFWKRYSCGLLLLGTIYPVTFVAAEALGWFHGPFFN